MRENMSYVDESLSAEVDRRVKEKLKKYLMISLPIFAFVAISAPIVVWACLQTSSSKSTNAQLVELLPINKPNLLTTAADQKPDSEGEKFDEITTTKPYGDSLTFEFRMFVKKYEPFGATLVCSVPNSTLRCPGEMETFANLMKAETQSSINGFDPLFYVVEVGRLTFHETFVEYQTRQKFSAQLSAKELKATIIKSAKFDFNKRLKLGSAIIVKDNVVISAPEIQDPLYVYCPGAGTVPYLLGKISCPKMSKAEMQKFPNWMMAVLGLKSLNATMTTGNSEDWGNEIISEVSAVGTYQDGLTRKDVFLTINEFREAQDDWCFCMETWKEGQDVEHANEKCFQIFSTRSEFRKLLHEGRCHLKNLDIDHIPGSVSPIIII